MTLTFNTKDWGWLSDYWRQCNLEIENLAVKEGYTLSDIDDVVYYLTYWRFANDYVSQYSIRDAIYEVCTELGCIYHDVYELESDIRKYYI